MNYKFEEFKELATPDGFNYPVDVYWGTVYLGTLEAKPDGFVIKQFDTPGGKRIAKQGSSNNFKSQNLAAEVLHRTWKMYRYGGNDSPEPVPA